MHKYEIIQTIGEGAYGIVQKYRHKQTKEIVAIKKFKDSDEYEAVRKTTNRQIQLLKVCHSENVIGLKQAYKNKRIYNLLQVLEKTPQGLEPERIKHFVYQISKGLAYMHSINVVHRDIKPQNLLVDHKDHLKLCDFGFARQLKNRNEDLTDYVSTRWYRPPQLLVGARYGKQIDLWAVGCIMAELIDGDPLFPGENQIDQLYKIQKCLGELTPEHFKTFSSNKRFVGIKFPKLNRLESIDLRYFGKISSKGLSFLKGLLKMSPSQRMTAVQALEHSYFDDIRQESFLLKLKQKRQQLQTAKTSASTTPHYSNFKSKPFHQVGIPYIKNIKSLKNSSIISNEIKRITLRDTQQSRKQWHSSQLRERGVALKFANKSVSISQNPTKSCLQKRKNSINQLSRTQHKFGINTSKMAINRIYGSKKGHTKFLSNIKVLEQQQQST